MMIRLEPERTIGRKHRLLLVDDEPHLLALLERRFQREEFETLTAGDGQEGLTKARQERPDCIILDLMLPRLNGFELCGLLKNDPSLQDIPIIVLTAREESGIREDALNAGADDVFIKPCRTERLLAKIHALLARESST